MMDAHLYLLVDKAHRKFKIGFTVDVADRIKVLARDWGEVDLPSSYELVGTAPDIAAFEKTLHFIFRSWRLNTSSHHPGFREWFGIACLEDVVQEIESVSRHQQSNRKLRKGIEVETRERFRATRSPCAAKVLFPEYRWLVLKLFFQSPGESHHVREVARLTHTVPGTVNRELKTLAAAGLLRSEHTGNHLRYAANQDFNAFEEIRRIVTKLE